MQGHVSPCIVSGKRLLSAAWLCCVIAALLLQMLDRLSARCLYKFNKRQCTPKKPFSNTRVYELFCEPLLSVLLICSCLFGCVSGMIFHDDSFIFPGNNSSSLWSLLGSIC